MAQKESAAMLLLGMGLGMYVPNLPEPLQSLNPYFGLILVIIAIILMVRK